MKECKADGEEVTLAEALEMADMELGAKKIKNYTQSEVSGKVSGRKRRGSQYHLRPLRGT